MLGGTRVVVGDYCAVAGAPTQAHTPASPPHVVGWKNGAQAPPSLNRHAGMCGRGSSSGSDARRTCRSICCRTTCGTTRFPTLTVRHPPGRAPATREEQSSPGILAQGGKRQRCPLPPPPPPSKDGCGQARRGNVGAANLTRRGCPLPPMPTGGSTSRVQSPYGRGGGARRPIV